MPEGSWKGRCDAQCPFFRSAVGDQKKQISCEGIVDRSVLTLTFNRKRDYETQLVVFCCEHFKKCEIYNMIMAAKYDDEED